MGGSQHTRQIETALKATTSATSSKTSIQWFGYQSDPRPFYAAADWHIAPSICEEAFGNVVREAQSFATPSIVSPNGGLPETIEDGTSGLVLDSVTSKSIHDCIKHASQLNLADFQKEALQYGTVTNNQQLFEQSWLRVFTT